LIKGNAIVCASISKRILHKQKLSQRQFFHFPNLASIKTADDDSLVYFECLGILKQDFVKRYQYLLNMVILEWVLEPSVNVSVEVPVSLQEELIDLSTNEELKFKLQLGYQEFWLQRKISTLYPTLWVEVKKFFIAFPSSYLAERGFSVVTHLLTKKRNRLSIVERGDLRLLMTTMVPDIEKLVLQHQCHISH